MKTGFEDRFMEIQSDFISLCLELTHGMVDKIFAYASIEKSSTMFNAFFEKDGNIVSLYQIEKMLNISDKTSWDFLKIGTKDLQKVKELCEEYETPTPTEIKMYYDVGTHKYNAECKYEEICSSRTGLSAGNVFDAWFEEMKK